MSQSGAHVSRSESVVFGGGCFWCTEAVFRALRGVVSVTPGYAGGRTPNPTYEEVCAERTGHAEVVLVEYDPSLVSYNDLLAAFFATHDPSTPNQQGVDRGTQYRSLILTTTPEQTGVATALIERLRGEGAKVTTEVAPLAEFYPAETEHIRFYERNPRARYCQLVIDPKLEKLQQRYAALLEKPERI